MSNTNPIVTFLSAWIAIQLAIIGIAYVNYNNQIIKGTYDCHLDTSPEPLGIVFPLIAFVPESDIAKEFCDNKGGYDTPAGRI